MKNHAEAVRRVWYDADISLVFSWVPVARGVCSAEWILFFFTYDIVCRHCGARGVSYLLRIGPDTVLERKKGTAAVIDTMYISSGDTIAGL